MRRTRLPLQGGGACDFVLDPDRPAPDDRPIWRMEELPFVVLIGASPRGFPADDIIDPDALPEVVTRFADADGLHLTIGRGPAILRLRFEHGSRRHGAIILPRERYEKVRADSSLWFLRWLRGRASEPSPEGARLTPFRRKRLRTLLELLDHRRAGASARHIAERLIDPALSTLSAAAWADSSERKRIRRWAADAQRLVTGGYRDILHGV